MPLLFHIPYRPHTMLSKLVTLTIMVLAGQASAAVMGTDIETTALQTHICWGETTDRFCYTEANGTPQNVNVSDVIFIAKYLRSYGRQSKPGRFFTMRSNDTKDCGEWTAYSHGSALVAVKHITDTIDSSVLYEDLATTIDGGEKATPEEQKKALLGCGTDGGAVGVQVNSTNPAYKAASYISAGYKTSGLLLKVVTNPPPDS